MLIRRCLNDTQMSSFRVMDRCFVSPIAVTMFWMIHKCIYMCIHKYVRTYVKYVFIFMQTNKSSKCYFYKHVRVYLCIFRIYIYALLFRIFLMEIKTINYQNLHIGKSTCLYKLIQSKDNKSKTSG